MIHQRRCCPFRLLIAALTLASLLSAGCAHDQKSRQLADVHLANGIAHIESEQYTTALRELFEARNLNPRNPEIHYYLGIAYWGRGLKTDSMASFTRALELKPDYSEAHNYLGLVQFEQGQYNAAVTHFERALDNVLYDTPEFALFNMGRAYREMGDDARALACFEQSLRMRPNRILPLVHNAMGSLLLSLGDVDEALFHLREATQQAPYVADFRLSLGRALLARGHRAEAIRELRQVLELAPDSGAAVRARDILTTLPAQ